MAASGWQRAPTIAFVLTLAYVVMDMARPQDVFKPLGAIRPSLLISVLLLGALVLENQRARFDERRFHLFAALLMLMALWVPLARNNHYAFTTFTTISQLVVFGLALASFTDTPQRLRIVVMTWLFAISFQGIWAINNGGRGTGNVFYDENDLALAMTMGLPFTWLLMKPAGTTLMRIGLVASAAIMLAGTVVSLSRGGFVGLLSVAGVIWLMSKNKIRILAAGIVAVLGLVALAPASYWDEMATINDKDDGTRNERLISWTLGWRCFLDNPIFGVGQGNVPWNLHFYDDRDNAKGLGGRQTHSLYFTLLPDLGVVGLGLYGGLLVLHIRSIRRVMKLAARKRYAGLLGFEDGCARAILCATAAYLVNGIFLSVLYYPHFYYLVFMSFIVEQQAMSRVRDLDRRAAQAAARPVERSGPGRRPAASPIPSSSAAGGLGRGLLGR